MAEIMHLILCPLCKQKSTPIGLDGYRCVCCHKIFTINPKLHKTEVE